MNVPWPLFGHFPAVRRQGTAIERSYEAIVDPVLQCIDPGVAAAIFGKHAPDADPRRCPPRASVIEMTTGAVQRIAGIRGNVLRCVGKNALPECDGLTDRAIGKRDIEPAWKAVILGNGMRRAEPARHDHEYNCRCAQAQSSPVHRSVSRRSSWSSLSIPAFSSPLRSGWRDKRFAANIIRQSHPGQCVHGDKKPRLRGVR